MDWKHIWGKMHSLSKLQIMMMTCLAAFATFFAGTSVYGMSDYNLQMREVITARVVQEEPEEPEEEEPPIEEPLEEEPEEEEPEEEIKELSLVGTSIEKDLKIKIEDQHQKVVSGEVFSVTVKGEKKGAKAAEYEDKDKDGIIYIEKIEAGKYTIDLKEIEGYIMKNTSISVTVKDKIEYKKVDVTGEIKKESEVNVSAEDTAVNNVPDEGSKPDSTAIIESKVTTSTVDKKDVVLPGNVTAALVVSSENNSVTLTKKVLVSETPEIPVTPETPTAPEETTLPEGEQSTEQPKEGDAAAISLSADASLLTMDTRTVSNASLLSMDTKTAPATKELTATISLPKSVTLYNSDDSSLNNYTLNLAISGENSLVGSVEWKCSDSSVAWLSNISGLSTTVTKEGIGTATVEAIITYETDETGSTSTAAVQCAIKVEEPSSVDLTAVLKDKSGNTLYLDSQAKTVATVKDYESHDKFYLLPQYTGWQTLDGKVYYYSKDHVALTGKQTIGGVTYTFAEDGSLLQSSGTRGIDVSKYQGNIDWGAVAASGISFAIIRAGYRGSSTGVLVEDPYFKKNISGATKAGIKVGIYFFTQAITEAEAVEEASMALSLISGYQTAYPVFIDTESASNGRANGLSKSQRTAVVKAFCQTVQNGGRKAGVYASKSWYINQLNASALGGYCIWVAQYSASCTYSGKYEMWQYSSKGSVPGIKGNVDMNISYVGY